MVPDATSPSHKYKHYTTVDRGMVPHGRPALRPVHLYCGAAHHDRSLHLLRRLVGPWPQGIHVLRERVEERERARKRRDDI